MARPWLARAVNGEPDLRRLVLDEVVRRTGQAATSYEWDVDAHP